VLAQPSALTLPKFAAGISIRDEIELEKYLLGSIGWWLSAERL